LRYARTRAIISARNKEVAMSLGSFIEGVLATADRQIRAELRPPTSLAALVGTSPGLTRLTNNRRPPDPCGPYADRGLQRWRWQDPVTGEDLNAHYAKYVKRRDLDKGRLYRP
jgi:hypothetical protein